MAVSGRSSGRSQEIAFGNIANSLKEAAFQFTAMAGAAQQLYSTLNVFRELQRQLTLTNAIAGGNVQTFKAMENAVRGFALGVTFTAAESANALLQLSQAGFTTEEAIKAMSGVLTLASATLEDVNETADLVASTLTSFSLEAGEAARLSNLFAASMNQSLSSLPKLSFALRQVGPVAASLGVSIEQTTGALSALFNVGLRGEQAGTALRNVMVNLVSPAGEAAKVIKTLGLNIYEADGTMRDFFDILKDLAKYNLSDTDLAALFGREALAGGTALLQSAASGNLDELTQNITGTQDAVRVALEQMTSFDAQLKQARNAIDEVRTSIGEDLANSIIPVLGYITDLGIAFRELDAPSKAWLLTLGKIGATTLVAGPILGKVATGLAGVAASMVTVSKNAVAGAADMVTYLRAINSAPASVTGMARTADQMKNLGLAATAAVGPLGLVAAAIVGAGGLIYAFKAARDAYDQARFDAMFGEFEEFANQLSRGFSNYRQMNAASQGTPDFLQGMVAQLDNARAIIKSKEGDIEYLKKQSDEFKNIQDVIAEAYSGGSSYSGSIGTAEYNKAIQEQLGINDQSSLAEIEAAIRKESAARTDKITALLDKINPQAAQDFQEALRKKMDDTFFKRLAAGASVNAGISNQFLTDAIEGVLGEATPDLASNISERIEAITAEIAKANLAIGNERNRTASLDFKPVLEDIQTSLFAEVPEQVREVFANKVTTADDVNAEFLQALAENAKNAASGDDKAREYINDVANIYKQRLLEAGVLAKGEIEQAVKDAGQRSAALIFSETYDKLDELAAKAKYDELKSSRQNAAAGGDKAAEKALREMEEQEKLINRLRSEAEQLVDGFGRAFDGKQGISDEMVGLLTGSTIADAIEAGGSERERVEKALNDADEYQKYIKERWAELANEAALSNYLQANNVDTSDIDVSSLFAASDALLEALNNEKATASDIQAAMTELTEYFAANNDAAVAVIAAAGIPIETLRDADIPQVAAGALMGMWGQQIINAIDTLDIGGLIASAFSDANGLVAGTLKAGKELVSNMKNALAAFSGGGLSGVGDAASNTLDASAAAFEKAQAGAEASRERIASLIKSANDRLSAANTRTDKRGGGGGGGKKGKTLEQQQSELESFLAERNKAIIEANIELAGFGEEFDVGEYIELRKEEVTAGWDEKIADVKEKYADMFKTVQKGTEDYSKLIEMRDRELEQLGKLKEANEEYANSSEFAARAANEAGQAVLDKYIEMHEYTGTFFQGLAAGAQDYVLNMQTNFQSGMETMTQLVDGFTTFGGNMFTDFFTKVATGEEKLGDVLKKNLAQMLLNWGKYFADLALKYLADWVLRKTLGLFGGGGTGFGTSFFPAAPTASVGLYAKGGAFDGPVRAFASGGIVRGSQYFGYGSEQNVGQMGEAGDEGILPLTRDSKGRLSVLTVGDKQGSEEGTPGVYQYNSSMSFDLRGSSYDETTSAALFAKMDQRAQEAARQTIVEEQRVGGLLYKR